MTRLIFKYRRGSLDGSEISHFQTVDVDCKELDQFLNRGGVDYQTGQYEIIDIVGFEIIHSEDIQ